MPSRDLPMDDVGLEARFNQLFASLDKLEAWSNDIRAEIGDVPEFDKRGDRKTLSERMDKMEQQTSEDAIEAAMLRAVRKLGGSLWTRGQKLLVIVAACAGAVDTILRVLHVGG